MPYAVIDLETTGLKAAWQDRIVEIAVVLLDDSGGIEHEWSTLVNPERDLGPQHIHGITAAQARQAPVFKQVAGMVADLLRSRVLVAHNLPFDAQFLVAEYRRLGMEIALGHEHGLCTMRLAGQFLPGSGRGLADCCDAAGVKLTNAHARAARCTGRSKSPGILHFGRRSATTLVSRMLVAADPDSMSGKAQKAAKYGIPIVHVRAFVHMLQAIGDADGG